MGQGKFQALFDKIKEKVDDKGGVKSIMSAWDKLGKDQPEQMYKGAPADEEKPANQEPKKDNKMLIYLGLGAVVLFMLMKKK
jgi:hypothetical protein